MIIDAHCYVLTLLHFVYYLLPFGHLLKMLHCNPFRDGADELIKSPWWCVCGSVRTEHLTIHFHSFILTWSTLGFTDISSDFSYVLCWRHRDFQTPFLCAVGTWCEQQSQVEFWAVHAAMACCHAKHRIVLGRWRHLYMSVSGSTSHALVVFPQRQKSQTTQKMFYLNRIRIRILDRALPLALPIADVNIDNLYVIGKYYFRPDIHKQ